MLDVIFKSTSNQCQYLYIFIWLILLVLSFAEKMNNSTEDPDFEVASSVVEVASSVGDHASFVSNTSSARLLRSSCHHLGPCHEGHGIQFNSRISPSPSR